MTEPFAAAKFIKEIGRGKHGARSMTREDAQTLYSAMLDGRISDLEMGGILLSMRIKGESLEEIAGFMAAAEEHMLQLTMPIALAHVNYAPIIIPSYNGARKKANLTPLLALLLAREGIPVVVHGVLHDAGRVTSAEIFAHLGIRPLTTQEQVQAQIVAGCPALIAIQDLSPSMHRLLEMRRVLGVRNSTHTIVKILQPFTCPALRLVSYTHPEYQIMLHDYFTQLAPHASGGTLLMRGTEGETVASTGRAQQITYYQQGQSEIALETQASLEAAQELPAMDATSSAVWIQQVLNGEIPVPSNIAAQVAICKRYAQQVVTI